MGEVNICFPCPHCGRGNRHKEKKRRVDIAAQKPLRVQCEGCREVFLVKKTPSGKFKCLAAAVITRII